MEERGQVGIGAVVMRNKQYVAAIRPRDDALALSTMHFADEVVPKSGAGLTGPASASPAPNELRLAAQIIDALTTKWDPQKYKDTYTNQVKQLIEAQADGEHIVADAPVQEAKVLDLMAALEASLKAARKEIGSPVPRSRDPQTGVQKTSEHAANRVHKPKAIPPAAKSQPRRERAKPAAAKASRRKTA